MRKQYDSLPNANQKRKHQKQTGFSGEYVFQNLPGHERITQSNPDGMHCLADSIKTVFNTVIGKLCPKGKLYELSLGRLSNDQSPPPNKKQRTEPGSRAGNLACGPWELDPVAISISDERALRIKYPPQSSLSGLPYFSNPAHLSKMEMIIKGRILCFTWNSTAYLYFDLAIYQHWF